MGADVINEQIFQALARLGTYSNFTPQKVSIGWVPFALRNRYLFSHPDIVRLVAAGLAPKVRELGVAALVGAETAGIPLAMALSLETNIPFAYVRKQPRDKGDRTYLEGDVRLGAPVALVDDLMASAASKQLFVGNLEGEGYQAKAIVVIWEGMTAGSAGDQWLKSRGLTVVSLFNWLQLADGLHRYGFIPDELYPHYVNSINNREAWSRPGPEWHAYVEVLRGTGRTVPSELEQWLGESL